MLQEYWFEDFYLRHAIDENPDDAPFTMHIHNQCEIYFFVSGNVEYLVEGSKYPLKSNSVMIMKPSEVHKAKIIGPRRYERYAINFPLSFIKNIDPRLSLAKPFLDRPLGVNNMLDESFIDADVFRKMFDDMFRETENEYDRQVLIKTHLLILLEIIKNAYNRSESEKRVPKTTAEKILVYINSHLYEPLSIPMLANLFYLSPAQFNRIFRQATGASAWEYITKKRLTAAREKIRMGTSSGKACESCGFNDYSAFYRAYKKYFGEAPTVNSNKCIQSNAIHFL